MSDAVNSHGTGIVLNGVGILLRGESGAGKSLLALELVDFADQFGQKVSLLADDRVELMEEDGALFMIAPANIGGLIELRGRGIVSRPHVDKAPLHLVVDIVDEYIRLIEEDEMVTKIEGIEVARCPVPNRQLIDSTHQRLLVREAIRALEA